MHFASIFEFKVVIVRKLTGTHLHVSTEYPFTVDNNT